MVGQKEQDEMEGGTPGFDQEKRSQAKRLDCFLWWKHNGETGRSRRVCENKSA